MYLAFLLKLKETIRFVAFIAGSFAAVLVLATVLDPDLFLSFEITSHRTVIFYLGVFGTILTVARGMIPEDNRVFDPELLMTEVIMYTHYMPEEWKVELHSKKVAFFSVETLHNTYIQPILNSGSSRIWRTIRYENSYLCSGTHFRSSDALGSLVLSTCLRSCYH
jgi:hypothetical protein